MPDSLSTRMGSSSTRYSEQISYLRGVDYTNSPVNVDSSRACAAPNMIRDVPGKVRKRMGYEVIRTYSGRINGIHRYDGYLLIHSGVNLYVDGATPELIYNAMPDAKSRSIRLNDKLMLVTGTKLLVYSCTESGGTVTHTVAEAGSIATVPQVTVGRAPSGGGRTLDAVNMLTNRFTDSFLGTAGATVYQLSFFPLEAVAVTAKIMNSAGAWINQVEGTNFTVNRTAGTVTFLTAPGASPVSGEDNVQITASSAHGDYLDRVNKCRFGIVYGVNGAADRLFLSGNPDHPNYDFFSGSGDPLFFGDIDYGAIGTEDSPITGYSIVNSALATHKASDDNERNCYLRTGKFSTDENDLQTVSFPVSQLIQGPGAISPDSFAYIKEPLFLTADGINATTPYEYNDRLYSQNRSFYLNGKLLAENDLSGACATAWGDFYLLAVNGSVYVLDVLQRDKTSATRGSEYQYEGYYWTSIPVRVWDTGGDRLCFGTQDGKLCRFFSEKMASHSYTDNGAAIDARWDFVHSGKHFHLNKTLKYFAASLMNTPRSSIKLYYKRSTETDFAEVNLNTSISYFSFSALSFSQFIFSGNTSAKTVGKKTKVKKYDSLVLSIRNGEAGQGVTIFGLYLEYLETNFYKLKNG